MEDYDKKEQMVDHYVKENNIEKAVKLLFELIISSARSQEFNKAETLREKLLEVDPMALTEITKSADVIEEEKSKMLDPDHLNTWDQLYSTLTKEETLALFFAMKPAEYSEGDTVFEQGQRNAGLYFIDEGNLRMVYRMKEEEILIKELGPGDFSGHDTFFSTTLFNSVSLKAGSNVKLRILHNDVLKNWSTHHTGLYPRLLDYCLKAGCVKDIFKEKKIERRIHQRFELSGKGVFQLLKKTGEPMGDPFKGTLVDISLGGLCFYMRISKRETARLLLGRKISLKFQIPKGQEELKFEQAGTIVGICEDAFPDYSIHVKFDKELDDDVTELFKEPG